MRCARVGMVVLGLALALCTGAAEPGKAAVSGPVTSWLLAGPLAAPGLVYGKESDGGAARLLGPTSLDPRVLWPSEGDTLAWAPGVTAVWKAQESRDGAVGRGKADELLYAAAYLRARRWTKATLRLDTSCAVAVYLDGAAAGQRLKSDPSQKEPDRFETELVLPTGSHRLLVVVRGGDKAGPSFRGSLSLPGGAPGPLPEITLSPRHPLSQEDVQSADFVTELALSGDGSRVAAVLRRTDRESDTRPTWIEVRDTADGRLLLNWKAASGLATPHLSPDGRKLFFTAKNGQDKEKRDLWCLDLGAGSARLLAEKLQGVKKLQCDPAGEFLYFLALAPKEKPAKEPPAVRFTEMYQRWSDWNDRPQLYQLSLKDRVLRPLTAGATNVQDYALSADGKKVALVRTRFVRERPYLTGEVWLQELGGGPAKRLLDWPRWPDLSEIAFSPDGKRLALVAPPSDMPPGGAKPEHMAYDLSLFVLDAAGGAPVRLLEKARPTATSQVTGALPGRRNLWWSPKDGRIYLVVTDRDRVRLLRTDAEGKSPEAVPLPDATLGTPELASSGNGFVWNGSSFGTFWTVRYADLATGRIRDLAQVGREVFSRVDLGTQEPFDLLARDGTPVQGWLFYPPDFDATKKYPLLVAYYGGVSPYAECFRPEFFWLAGQGYVVYLVTPRGSVGYGRDFADAHMNDWGKEAGEDILQGVRAVLKAKAFLDPKRVGCYGGSYGGFMSLYLVSHSDLFAAAVDFFGISDLASYWGAGWWGWNYGDTAMANSYPWNRKELFVERSPLYSADKIHAATLLLHGDSDTNVPPQESDQIFTALRVLGRTCEYVRFAGEDHGISGKPSVRAGSETMMLEWFDKHLKGQGEGWDYRWRDDAVAIERE